MVHAHLRDPQNLYHDILNRVNQAENTNQLIRHTWAREILKLAGHAMIQNNTLIPFPQKARYDDIHVEHDPYRF